MKILSYQRIKFFIGFTGLLLLLSSGYKAESLPPEPESKKSEPESPKPSELPKPPSTGHENSAPQAKPISQQESQELIKLAVGEFIEKERADETPDCQDISLILKKALWGGDKSTPITKDTEVAYTVLSICSSRNGEWLTTLQITSELMDLDASFPYSFLLPRSLIYLGEFKDAEKVLNKLINKHPLNPEILYTAALFASKIEDWSLCLKLVERTANALKKVTNEQAKLLLNRPVTIDIDNRILGGEAFFHLGKLKNSSRVIAQLVKQYDQAIAYLSQHSQSTSWPETVRAELISRLKRNELVDQSKISVEPELEVGGDEIYLGIYHLLGNQKAKIAPLLSLKLTNLDRQSRTITYEAVIEGVTQKIADSLLLLPNETKKVSITPHLLPSFAVDSITAATPTNLSLQVTSSAHQDKKRMNGGNNLSYQKTFELNLLPRNILPLAQKLGEDVLVPKLEFIGAWITPNVRAVDLFLQIAKKRAPDQTFAGTQEATVPQVKALFDELKSRGVSYVMDPTVLSNLGVAQRTRLPAEVLESTNAQCLEGTLLFATLLKAIGLEARVVKLPGHALVGFLPRPDERTSKRVGSWVDQDGYLYIETTVIHTANFEEALQIGFSEVKHERDLNHFGKGILSPAFFIDIPQLEQTGYLPQSVK